MDFNRPSIALRRAAACALCFAAGIAAVAAWNAHFYACLTLALVIALWMMQVARREDPPLILPPPPSPDSQAREAALLRLRTMLDHAPVPLLELTQMARCTP